MGGRGRPAVAHLEVSFTDNFKVAGGLFASVQKGSSFRFDQAPVGAELWLPTGAEAAIQARLLLVKGIRQHFTERDYDFKQFHVDAQQGRAPTLRPKQAVAGKPRDPIGLGRSTSAGEPQTRPAVKQLHRPDPTSRVETWETAILMLGQAAGALSTQSTTQTPRAIPAAEAAADRVPADAMRALRSFCHSANLAFDRHSTGH